MGSNVMVLLERIRKMGNEDIDSPLLTPSALLYAVILYK